MRTLVILAGAAALLAGCNKDSDKQAAEGMVRAALVGQGNVQQIDLSKQADNSYAGTVSLRTTDGRTVSLNCTARRTGTDSNANYNAHCGQVLDQALLDEIKTTLRRSIEGTGATVTQLDMTRRDDNAATGSAQARNPDGQIVQLTCEAARQADGTFNSRCQPVAGTAQGEQAPAQEEQAPTDDAQ